MGAWPNLSPAKCSSATRSASARASRPTAASWPGSPLATGCSTCGSRRSPPRIRGRRLGAATAVTEDTDRGIRDFAWARDGRHLLYLQDTGGDENWRLYDVDLETADRRDLTPFDGIQARIIATRKSHRDDVLVGVNRDNPQLHDVYRLSLTSGELVKLIENPGYAGWLADEDMVVRGALSPLPDGGFDLLVRDGADDDWRTLLTIPADDVTSSGVLAFSGDGRSLLAISSIGTDTGRLSRVDLATGEAQVLLEDAEADVESAILHPDTKEPQIVEVLKDRTEYHVLDPSVEPDFKAIRALHPGDPQLVGRDEADATWLVGFTDDVAPVQYYAYDRGSRTGSFLFSSRPELSRYDLARMEPFSFKARDGLTIHGYATFPADGGRSGLPTVLNVHGGPQTRDVWGWDPEAQWLANRGYLCIQVNYRGSTGYGKSFVAAGDREWGAKMHDDLLDAVQYAVGRAGPTRPRSRFTAVPTAATRPWWARRSPRTCSAARWTSSARRTCRRCSRRSRRTGSRWRRRCTSGSATRRRTRSSCGRARRCPGPVTSASRC